MTRLIVNAISNGATGASVDRARRDSPAIYVELHAISRGVSRIGPSSSVGTAIDSIRAHPPIASQPNSVNVRPVGRIPSNVDSSATGTARQTNPAHAMDTD